MIEFTKKFVEEICDNLEGSWPMSLAEVQKVVRTVAEQGRLSGLVEAAQLTRDKKLSTATYELTSFAERELNAEYRARGLVRFPEEKPPAGHHAPAPEESEGV